MYDLQFTLIGNYVSITDFIYDIENDEQLKFEIKNFSILTQANATATTNKTNTATNTTNTATNTITNTTTNTNKNTTTTTAKTDDGTMLQATFTVENVGITLD